MSKLCKDKRILTPEEHKTWMELINIVRERCIKLHPTKLNRHIIIKK